MNEYFHASLKAISTKTVDFPCVWRNFLFLASKQVKNGADCE